MLNYMCLSFSSVGVCKLLITNYDGVKCKLFQVSHIATLAKIYLHISHPWACSHESHSVDNSMLFTLLSCWYWADFVIPYYLFAYPVGHIFTYILQSKDSIAQLFYACCAVLKIFRTWAEFCLAQNGNGLGFCWVWPIGIALFLRCHVLQISLNKFFFLKDASPGCKWTPQKWVNAILYVHSSGSHPFVVSQEHDTSLISVSG